VVTDAPQVAEVTEDSWLSVRDAMALSRVSRRTIYYGHADGGRAAADSRLVAVP
jgi:hypothetical protein